MINIKALIYVYSSVLLLILITALKDRYKPRNEILASHHWGLAPAIIMLSLFSSNVVVQSCWNYIPILRNYEYNPFNWEIFSFFYLCSVVLLEYVILCYVYKAPIVEAFNLKLTRFPFVLKLCGVLAVVNILSVIFLDLNLILKPQESDLKIIELLNDRNFLLYSLNTVLLVPIAEEGVFRGLIYSPLYRKVGRFLAIVLSSLFWALGHFYPLQPSIGIFVNGLILAWLYDRSGSLVHPLIFHMFRNSWIIVYYYKIL